MKWSLLKNKKKLTKKKITQKKNKRIHETLQKERLKKKKIVILSLLLKGLLWSEKLLPTPLQGSSEKGIRLQQLGIFTLKTLLLVLLLFVDQT